MFSIFNFLLLFLFILLVLIPSTEMYKADKEAWKKHQYDKFSLGGIIDHTSRARKEEKVAMKMAADDFFAHFSHRFTLNIKNSRGDPVLAATSERDCPNLVGYSYKNFITHAAKSLVKNFDARVVVGLGTWQEAAFVADLANNFKVPFLSWANEVPSWVSSRWPFLVYTARSQFAQMKAVAAIIRSWQWTKVNIIYEDNNLAFTGMIPYLIDSLQEVGTEINDLEAKILGMMEKEFVWITTNSITDAIDSLSGSIITSMHGVLRIKSYFSPSGKQFTDFRSRFQVMFHRQYPEETHLEPGIFALQAYDVVRAVAFAMGGNSDWKHSRNSTYQFADHMVPLSGKKLLNRILKSNFEGLRGPFHFKKGMLVPAQVYRIVNVFGTSCRELGYWTEGLGFSVSTRGGSTYNESMRILKKVVWPGDSRSVPSGLGVEGSAKGRLRIGVPMGNSHIEFVNVRNDRPDDGQNITGFSIEIFKIIANNYLPKKLQYDFVPFPGTYTALVEQVSLENFDAVVGDTAIIANRSKYAEFSQPYAEPGIQMVVLVKPRISGGAWLFQKPFTTGMWATTGAIVLYNGLVVWLIERKHHPEFATGTKFNQVGSMVSLAFTTLLSLHGEKLHSNLSRMTMVVSLFMALIITQSYTASLTSLLTHQRFEPTIPDVNTLKRNGEKVGCVGNSFVVQYLEEVLHFDPANIQKIYSEDGYYQNLTQGVIAAAFLEVPYVKVFLANHCKKFTTGPITYAVGGFGFNSPYLPDISHAILQLSEEGTLQTLAQKFNISSNCSDSENDEDQESLALYSFEGLFYVTIAASTTALILFIIRSVAEKHRFWHSNIVRPQAPNIHAVAFENWVWQEPHADHEQPHVHEHWLSAWEMENQSGRLFN